MDHRNDIPMIGSDSSKTDVVPNALHTFAEPVANKIAATIRINTIAAKTLVPDDVQIRFDRANVGRAGCPLTKKCLFQPVNEQFATYEPQSAHTS
jgi:hypothetical protein